MSITNFSGKIVALSLVAIIFSVAILGFVGYSALSAPRVARAAADSSTSLTTTASISVSGVGIVNVKPDEIVIDLGVTNQGSNATQVLISNSNSMNAVTSAIENMAGINSSYVQTTQFNFGPTYSNYGQISGYQASNTVQVTLQGSDTPKLNSVINVAVNAGANQIQSIGYTMSNSLQAQVKRAAMQAAVADAAVADANGTAQGVASSEGLRITGIQSVQVLGNSYPQYYNNVMQIYAITTVASGPNYSVPISPGES